MKSQLFPNKRNTGHRFVPTGVETAVAVNRQYITRGSNWLSRTRVQNNVGHNIMSWYIVIFDTTSESTRFRLRILQKFRFFEVITFLGALSIFGDVKKPFYSRNTKKIGTVDFSILKNTGCACWPKLLTIQMLFTNSTYQVQLSPIKYTPLIKRFIRKII